MVRVRRVAADDVKTSVTSAAPGAVAQEKWITIVIDADLIRGDCSRLQIDPNDLPIIVDVEFIRVDHVRCRLPHWLRRNRRRLGLRGRDRLTNEMGQFPADVPQFFHEHERHERPTERNGDIERDQPAQRGAKEDRDARAESSAGRTLPCDKRHRGRRPSRCRRSNASPRKNSLGPVRSSIFRRLRAMVLRRSPIRK